MSITDVISQMRLHVFPQIALVLFLLVFVAVLIRLFVRRSRVEFEHASRLPLEDDAVTGARSGGDVSHARPLVRGVSR